MRVFRITGALSLIATLQIFANPTLRYVPNKAQVKEIILENSTYKYTIVLDNAVRIRSILEKSSGYDYMENNQDLIFTSSLRPTTWHRFLDNTGYQLFKVDEINYKGRKGVSISQQSSYVENSWTIVQEFSLGDGNELHWKSKAIHDSPGRSYREPRIRHADIRFPVMQDLLIGEEEDLNIFLPTQRTLGAPGSSYGRGELRY